MNTSDMLNTPGVTPWTIPVLQSSGNVAVS
jgi:hypothetical protein